MKVMLALLVSLLISLLPLVSVAYGYEFSAHAPEADSVRLVLNPGASHDDIVAIDVVAQDVPPAYAAAFDVDFDSGILEWAGGSETNNPDGFSKGDFFGSGSVMIGHEILVGGDTNYDKVIVGVVGDFFSPDSGSGTIVTLNFRLVGTGQSQVDFSASNLIKEDGSFTPTSWYGGTFEATSLEPYGGPTDDPPLVQLILPSDNSMLNRTDVTLACSASDDLGLASISLYTDVTGVLSLFETRNAVGSAWSEEFLIQGVSDGTYMWNCMATDSAMQQSWGESSMHFSVQLPADITPPLRSNPGPQGDVASGEINITLATNEPAVCRYSVSPGMRYSDIPFDFVVTGQTTHLLNVTLWDNATYFYHVRCKDASGNENVDDFTIEFTVHGHSGDSDPPGVLIFSASNDVEPGTQYSLISMVTEEVAECRWSESQGTQYASMERFDQTYSSNHTHTVIGLSDGLSKMLYVRCADESGNINDETSVEIYVCRDADSDCSRSIDLPEVNSYIQRWYVDRRDVSMGQLIDTIVSWTSGG